MAQRVILADDLDQSEGDVTSHVFSLDGSSFAIDLAPKNLEKLTKALQPFIDAARPASSVREVTPVPKPAKRARKAQGGEEYPRELVRSWARSQGISVGDRGRIKADVVSKWREAGSPEV